MLAHALNGLRLVDHPFYQRWNMGAVSRAELRAYAAQYRHFERAVPGVLAQVAAQGSPPVRAQALQNLADERTHLALFDAFADALEADRDAEPSPAMRALLAVYERACAAGALEGFAALWAYEAQAAKVSALKATALRKHYNLDGRAAEFWDVHAALDDDHAAWAEGAIASSPVEPFAREAAQAWWNFLDERESLGRDPRPALLLAVERDPESESAAARARLADARPGA